jgi:hypothetical protein
MPQQPNHYHTLGISPSVDEKDIKRAYRALAKRYHPDRVPLERREWARTRMADINAAYKVLSDPLRRAQYDHESGFESAKQPQAAPKAAIRRRSQRVRERSRRGQLERQRVITLTGAATLGIVLVAGLFWFRWLGRETTAARCAWAIALAVGVLMVLAALRLTEL